jgi:hypothetical protein
MDGEDERWDSSSRTIGLERLLSGRVTSRVSTPNVMSSWDGFMIQALRVLHGGATLNCASNDAPVDQVDEVLFPRRSDRTRVWCDPAGEAEQQVGCG